MRPSTNLALHPFRNERLPWLLAALLILTAILVSLAHGRFVLRLLSGDEAKTVRQVREDETRIAELEARISNEPPIKVDAAELQRLRAFKDLVDRRVFPWRRLLAHLESTLSDDVRLTRISPEVGGKGKGMTIELAGQARTKDAAFALAEALDASPVFSNASLKSLAEEGSETRFVLEVEFAGVASEAPSPSAPPVSASGAAS